MKLKRIKVLAGQWSKQHFHWPADSWRRYTPLWLVVVRLSIGNWGDGRWAWGLCIYTWWGWTRVDLYVFDRNYKFGA